MVAMPETMEDLMKLPTAKEELDHIAQRFQWARLTLNLRIEEAVGEAGSDDIDDGCQRLRAIENSTPQPDIGTYERFARVLDIDLDELHEELEALREQRRRTIRQDLPPRILGRLIEAARQKLGLTDTEIVDRTQLAPTKRYERRLRRLEAGKARFPTDDEIEAFAPALSVSTEAMRRAFEEERRVYDRRHDGPRLFMRVMPAVSASVPIPDSRSTKWYLDYADDYARDRAAKVCLVFGDERSVYINPDGTRTERYQPPRMALRYSLPAS